MVEIEVYDREIEDYITMSFDDFTIDGITIEEHDMAVKADAIDEVISKLYDIRDSLPLKYAEHWTSRDSDAISALFIEYEKQLKEQ